MRLRAVTKEEQQLQKFINEETGEVDSLEIEKVEMQKVEKVTNLVHIFKEYEYESEKFKSEIEKLQDRKRVSDNAIKSLKTYIELLADGEKYEGVSFKIGFRKSESIEIDELNINVQNLKVLIPGAVIIEYKFNKSKIKEYYRINKTLPEGVSIVEKNNIQIK